jgi:hypothetical protein
LTARLPRAEELAFVTVTAAPLEVAEAAACACSASLFITCVSFYQAHAAVN